MNKNLKKTLAILLAMITICSVFTGCKNKEEEGTNPTVNGTTQAEGWSDITTTKKDDESTSSSTTENTTKKETTTAKKETTTKTHYNNNGSNSGKPVTTTKKHETTTKKPVTTTKPPVTTTKPAAKKPLTDAQKQWVIQNTFEKFPQYGAKPGFYAEDIGTDNGLGQMFHFTQDNYKAIIDDLNNEGYFQAKAKGCACVEYNWSVENGESVLRYSCWKN